MKPYYLKYFGQRRSTDVLAFPMNEAEHLGSIVISVETARRQAGEHKLSTWNEIRFLIIHGYLHLLGYDHAEADEKKAMQQKENSLLTRTMMV